MKCAGERVAHAGERVAHAGERVAHARMGSEVAACAIAACGLAAGAIAVCALAACGEPKGRPSAIMPEPASAATAAPQLGELDAGAATRATLQQVTSKAQDGRYVVDAIVVRVSGDAIVVTNDFADSATWTLRATDVADRAKRFAEGGRYRLLVLVQRGEPRILDAGR